MNAIQKIIDAALVVMGILVFSTLYAAVITRPIHVPPVERLHFDAESFLMCDVGSGPNWDDLQAMTVSIRN